MRRGAVRDRARDQQELAADPARRRADSVQTTPTERELLHRPSEVGQMVTRHPGAVPGRHVLALQRSIGNRAVASLLVGRHSSAQTATEDLEDETAPERTVPTAAVEHPDASAPERASEATPATVPGDPVARPGSHLRSDAESTSPPSASEHRSRSAALGRGDVSQIAGHHHHPVAATVSRVALQRNPPTSTAAPPTTAGAPPTTSTGPEGSSGVGRSERAKWQAAATHFNLPTDSGHIVSNLLLERGVWKKVFQSKADREQVLKRAQVLEHNMYGGGKLGAAMGHIDTASRILHLVGMISGILGLVAGAVGIAFPAALPVAAIAGMIAMAAHGVMAVLQSILVGHNVIRLRAAKTPDERAKILPTLYRDISKLVFAIVGVAVGGAGTGLAAAHGVMSTAALGGADLGGHIGTLVAENVGEGAAGTGMFYTIAKQNYNEGEMGERGMYDRELAGGHGGGHDSAAAPHGTGGTHDASSSIPSTTASTASNSAAPSHAPVTAPVAPTQGESPTTTPESPSPTAATSGGSGPTSAPNIDELVEDATATRRDVGEGVAATTEMEGALESQRGLVGGINQITDARQQLVQATRGLDDNDSAARENVDDHPERERENKTAVAKAEQGIQEASSLDGQQTRPRADSVQSRQPTGVQTKRVQRAGLFSRFTSWVKKKIAGLFSRFKGAVAALKSKLTAMAMKMMGIDKLQGDLGAGLGEQQQRVASTKATLNDANAASEEYSTSATQLRELANARSSGSGEPGQ